MLASNKIVGFIATKNPKKAREFYEKTLGLQFESEDQFATVFRSHGTMIRVAAVQDFEPFPFTVLGWEVENIGKYAAGLKERGVKFERFDGLSQDDLGVWNSPSGAKVAWFKDTDGNVLSISEHP